jgi:hypothetical protein
MKTIVQIDGKSADGSSSLPHLSISDADFVPRIGDFIKFGTNTSKVMLVEYEYATMAGRPHIVHVTTMG